MTSILYYFNDQTFMIRSINNSYEYERNSAHFFITPLADRNYQDIFVAFIQNLSEVQYDPAGTVKTETIRVCSKALVKSYIVYHSSKEVTSKQMCHFFTGLATSGNFSYFDEFSSTNIEVLSVIIQQIRTIQNGISFNEKYEFYIMEIKT
jgi:dynein heavy chain